jgi:hypothetical protein
MSEDDPIPWDELDPPIVPLVGALNRFPGIRTIGSCGGHSAPERDQAGAGEWWVLFQVDHSEEGWLSLEFLSWLVNRDGHQGGSSVLLRPDSAPPWLNYPGSTLRFLLELDHPGGPKDSPAELAAWIVETFDDCYVDARVAANWEDELAE